MLIPIACILLLIITFIYKKITSKEKKLEGKHVLVTGGSSGIGKAIAILAVKQGAHVTIVARDEVKLKKVGNELQQVSLSKSQKIMTIALDVTHYNNVEKCLNEIDDQLPVYMLVNCAGMSICGKIEDLPITDTQQMFDLNFYGTYFPTRVIVPKMKIRKEGYIIVTGSQASLLGIFGFSSYSATKFALRGFAEALDMEVRLHNINVTLALPPDTDTPGFEKENLTKTKETRLISESGGLYQAEQVAKKILKDAMAGHFFSSIGFESFLLTTLCVGMTRHTSFFDIFSQSLLMGPFKLISSFYLYSFHKIIKEIAVQKSATGKKNN